MAGWAAAGTLVLGAAPLAAQEPAAPEPAADDVEIVEGLLHLGNDPVEEWGDRASVDPDGTELVLPFVGRASDADRTLVVWHLDVHENWTLTLNDTVLGRLPVDQAWGSTLFMVPPGAVRDGQNTLRLTPDRVSDDILVGDIRLSERRRCDHR